ncbi:MAG TPA: hypothetical protein VGI12_03650 [Vicinamibacterales bacterium]|jgi:hypothetical protein
MQTCPNCGTALQVESSAECPRCGVVFAKLHGQEVWPVAGRVDAPPAADVATPAANQASDLVRIVRFATLVALAVWSVSLARVGITPNVDGSFLHLPDLVFHEAGHVIFGFFGRFMTVLGGSLFQCLVPVLCAVAFLRQRNMFAAALCVWWLGQNLLDLAPYIADARALQLILLGGHTGAEVEGHDWEYLLTELGWLHRDVTFGLAAYRAGLVTMAAALLWGAVAAWREASTQATGIDA